MYFKTLNYVTDIKRTIYFFPSLLSVQRLVQLSEMPSQLHSKTFQYLYACACMTLEKDPDYNIGQLLIHCQEVFLEG